jgi:hypothetical protein
VVLSFRGHSRAGGAFCALPLNETVLYEAVVGAAANTALMILNMVLMDRTTTDALQ